MSSVSWTVSSAMERHVSDVVDKEDEEEDEEDKNKG